MSIDTFRHLLIFLELLAAITGSVYFFKYKNTQIKYFLYLLWYITITEFTGWYASENDILVFFDQNGIDYNHWFFNLLYFIFFIVVLKMYSRSIKNARQKKWIDNFIILYIIISIINWSLIQSFIFEMSELPFVVGSVFLIISIVFYLIELLKSEKVIVYHRKLLFWISIGLLFFHSGTIPFSLKYNEYSLFPGIDKLFLIIYVLSFFMYAIFIFGFIWSNKEEKE